MGVTCSRERHPAAAARIQQLEQERANLNREERDQWNALNAAIARRNQQRYIFQSLDQYLAQTDANYVAGVNRALGNAQISVTEIAAGRYRYLSDDNRYYIDFK